jgi:hypothetical protein
MHMHHVNCICSLSIKQLPLFSCCSNTRLTLNWRESTHAASKPHFDQIILPIWLYTGKLPRVYICRSYVPFLSKNPNLFARPPTNSQASAYAVSTPHLIQLTFTFEYPPANLRGSTYIDSMSHFGRKTFYLWNSYLLNPESPHMLFQCIFGPNNIFYWKTPTSRFARVYICWFNGSFWSNDIS